MFTGLIQQVCSVKSLVKSGDTAALTIDLSNLPNKPKSATASPSTAYA